MLSQNTISSISQNYGPTSVIASRFFVSYNSVMTLAYKGFSRTLLDVKSEVSQSTGGLKSESPGSLWPKATLGCLDDNISLTKEEAEQLCLLCEEHSLLFDYQVIAIDKLDLVEFEMRTLERLANHVEIPLLGRELAQDVAPQDHITYVDSVLSAFAVDRLGEYYPRMAPSGRTMSYYREPYKEWTLVSFISPLPELRSIIQQFQHAVDALLPGKYVWFDPKSWHMTVRALVPQP